MLLPVPGGVPSSKRMPGPLGFAPPQVVRPATARIISWSEEVPCGRIRLTVQSGPITQRGKAPQRQKVALRPIRFRTVSKRGGTCFLHMSETRKTAPRAVTIYRQFVDMSTVFPLLLHNIFKSYPTESKGFIRNRQNEIWPWHDLVSERRVSCAPMRTDSLN